MSVKVPCKPELLLYGGDPLLLRTGFPDSASPPPPPPSPAMAWGWGSLEVDLWGRKWEESCSSCQGESSELLWSRHVVPKKEKEVRTPRYFLVWLLKILVETTLLSSTQNSQRHPVHLGALEWSCFQRLCFQACPPWSTRVPRWALWMPVSSYYFLAWTPWYGLPSASRWSFNTYRGSCWASQPSHDLSPLHALSFSSSALTQYFIFCYHFLFLYRSA